MKTGGKQLAKTERLCIIFPKNESNSASIGISISYNMVLTRILKQHQIRKSTSSKGIVTPMYLFKCIYSTYMCLPGKLAYNKK
jgi:hypothetical protein